jgi:hypothetical protein
MFKVAICALKARGSSTASEYFPWILTVHGAFMAANMIPFHSVLPEIAQREVRCLYVANAPNLAPGSSLPPGEYAFLEFYCEDLDCDCRRVFIQVIARHRRDDVLASISYGWEKESFYRKRMSWNPEDAVGTVRGELDPLNKQSKYSGELLYLFQTHVLDQPYRLRLRRHYRLFRDELRRRQP